MGDRALPAPAVRWALVLSILCGVLAMHALVLGHSTHVAAAFPSGTPASASPAGHEHADPPPAATSPWTRAVAAHPDGHDAAGRAGHLPAAPAGHDHGVLHLCLAVLTALAGLVAVPLLVRLLLPVAAGPDPRIGHGRRAATTPAAPPPPSAVRLAQLCVLRT